MKLMIAQKNTLSQSASEMNLDTAVKGEQQLLNHDFRLGSIKRISRVFSGMMGRVTAARERQKNQSELTGLADHLLHDIGLERSETGKLWAQDELRKDICVKKSRI